MSTTLSRPLSSQVEPAAERRVQLPTVLVTGCSSGIGRAIALLLADSGYHVLAGVRSAEQATSLAEVALPRLEPVLLDVTDQQDVDRVVQHLGRVAPHGLYALINNAGLGSPGAVELAALDEVRQLLEVNTVGPLRLIQACLPLLRQGSGRVINMSSMNGMIAMPMVGAYSASKFALEALCDTLRVELRPWRIPVVIVRPGQVRTSIFSKAREALSRGSQEIPEKLHDGYAPLYAQTSKFNERGAQSKTSPEVVARTVLRALRAKRPRTHYHIGLDVYGLLLAKSLMPRRLLDRVMARAAGVLK